MGFIDDLKAAWSQLFDCIAGEGVEDRLGCIQATLSEYGDVFLMTGAGAVGLILLLKLLSGEREAPEAETREVKIVID